MNVGRTAVAAVVFALAFAAACGNKPKIELSGDVKKEIAALRTEKLLIDEKIRDVENFRALIEQRNRDDLENMRRAIETIQSALGKIQARLDAMEAVPPAAPPQPKRLSPMTIAILVIVMVLCILIALKLRQMRLQDRDKAKPQEAPVESSSNTSESGPPKS